MTNYNEKLVYVCPRCGAESYDAVRHFMQDCKKSNQAVALERMVYLSKTGTSKPTLRDLRLTIEKQAN